MHLRQNLPIGFILLLVGFPMIAASLVGGGARMVRKHGLAQKVLAPAMLVLAVPVGLYAILLILAAAGGHPPDVTLPHQPPRPS